MTDQLRSALQDLADTAPTAHVPDELWQRAQQSRRRRAVGAAALAAVFVTLTGFLVWGVVETRPLSATSSPVDYNDSDLALPDEFSRPSPWEGGTADEGPLGPLAAVGTVNDRQVSWWRTEPSLFGISAVTGEYRYLDLPRMSDADDFAYDIRLSPDGTKLAYWIEGEPALLSGEVRTVGYAVYDSVTGQTQFRDVARPFGIGPESLAWTADSADVVAYFLRGFPDEFAFGGGTTEVFHTASSAVTELSIPAKSGSVNAVSTWSSGSFAWGSDRRLTVTDLDTGDHTTTQLSHVILNGAVLSPDGSTAAVITGVTQQGSTVFTRLGAFDTSHIGADADVRLLPRRVLPGQVVGWVDNDTVLIEQARLFGGPSLSKVDVATGEISKVAELSAQQASPMTQFSRDLAERPLVHRDGPAYGWDPRALVVAGGLLALLLAYVARAQVVRRRKRDAVDLLADSASPREPGP